MKILVTAATGAEIALSIKHIAASVREEKPMVFRTNGHEIVFAVTGVGMVATAYHLTRLLAAAKYDLVIQVGIAGSFDRNIPLGDTCLVRSDRFADMGAEDGETYIDVFDLGLADANERPFTDKILVNPYSEDQLGTGLKEVKAITMNTVTGHEATAKRLDGTYGCELESMEGAAFHYVCLQEQVMFAQVRAVSNYTERRNRSGWRIDEALVNLNGWLVRYLTGKTML